MVPIFGEENIHGKSSARMNRDQTDQAEQAWRRMFDFLMRSSGTRMESLGKRGLTPNDSRALFLLDRHGLPIGQLAGALNCDPSSATWIVDRLERAGMAERTSFAQDRRVRLVRATRKGIQTQKQLMSEYYRPPPEFEKLGPADIAHLDRILAILMT